MMTKEEYLRLADELFQNVSSTLKQKNNDYTGGSGDPFANFRLADLEGVDPRTGILIRVQDKLQRLRTYIKRGELAVEGEGWQDAVKDVIGYMTLLYGMMSESQPSAPSSSGPCSPPCSCTTSAVTSSRHGRMVSNSVQSLLALSETEAKRWRTG